MKISIGYKVVDGPWGGGNGFFAGLNRHLAEAGHEVVHDLQDDDIDLILITDPRRRNPCIPFTHHAAWRYARRRNPRCLIVHRINECDERKGTSHMNALLKRCNALADHTVFVGSWLRELNLWSGDSTRASVILNGSDSTLFNPEGFQPWNGTEPLRLVTHHWGAHWMKGFDIYEKLDVMMATAPWRDKIEFSYIGNIPKGFEFKHARHIAPLSGKPLADALRSHHAYVTGSQNEPGGNHQNEGAQCGLPVLFRRSGCMDEYLGSYGVGYDGMEDFESALNTLISDYAHWQRRILEYPNRLETTCANYETLFKKLLTERDRLIAKRSEREPLSARFIRTLTW